MKRFIKSDLLPILARMACFAVIFAGSGAFTTQKDNGIKHREPPRQRYLCEADQDPFMVNPEGMFHPNGQLKTPEEFLQEALAKDEDESAG